MKNFDMELILSIFGYLLCLLAGVFWVGPGTISPVFLALSAFLLVVVYVSVHPIGRKMRRLLARMFTKEDDEIAVTKQHKAIFRLLMLLVMMFTSFVTTSQAQSLLIDVSVNNTTPGASDVFTYKIRYRCASITDHCFNSHITFTLPASLDLVNAPPTGGNVNSVTVTGNMLDIYLVSPTSAGAPTGALAAGAAGILDVRVKFKCGANGVAPIPPIGSTINYVATFTATGAPTAIDAAPDVTVPTVSGCTAPPPPPPPTNITKYNGGAEYRTRQAGSVYYNGGYNFYGITIPAFAGAGPYVVEDDLPNGIWPFFCSDPSNIAFTEVYINGVWYAINSFGPSGYSNSDLGGWLNSVAVGAQLNADGGVPIPGCIKMQAPGGGFYSSIPIDKIRFTINGPLAATAYIDMYYMVAPNATPGNITNCVTSNNPAWTTFCADEQYITDCPMPSGGIWGSDYYNLGSTSLILGGYNVIAETGNTSLSKEANDALARVEYGIPNMQGGLVWESLLPTGFDYVSGGQSPNFWVIRRNDPMGMLIPTSDECLNPVFTRIPNYNGTGQTLLRWEFPACAGVVNAVMYFTMKYMQTTPLPGTLTTPFVVRRYDGGSVAMTSGYVFSGCGTSVQTGYNGYKPLSGGDVNSSKYVTGALDVTASRYPLSGNTNLSGDGVYDIRIECTDYQNIKQLDVADVLPYIGDISLLTGVNRGSAWSEELASAITVQRYKIGTGLVSADADLQFGGVQYTTSTNPCYLDAVLPMGSIVADMSQANFPAGCSDFSTGTPAVGARGFAFRWLNAADPLQFGEYLKITVNVKQLTGEADVFSQIAWNSLGYTATESDDDALPSTEPLKVGLKMLDESATAVIGDYVWLDGNGNGRQDAGETPLSGVTVSLYDAAGQPVLTGGIPTTALTNASGYYCFLGLTPNTNYYVRLDNAGNFSSGGVLANYSLTTANAAGVSDAEDSDAAMGTLAGAMTSRPQILSPTLGAGTQTKTYDFGFLCLGNINGYVWMDSDKGGNQSVGEMPISGVTVTLRDATTNAAVGSAQVSNSSGLFNFSDVQPGTYYVEFTTLPVGKIPTYKDLTGNDADDSDVNANGRTDVFVLDACEYLDFDLGLRDVPTNPATICGTAWDDLDKDGTQDGTEPGMPNITVQLLDNGGFVLNTVQTDGNGNYCFTNLDPNVPYKVAFVPPAVGVMFSVAGPDQDVDLMTGVTTAPYTPTDNQTINDVDAGFMGPLSIGNQVWLDANNNGLFDSGEAIFANIEMRLIAANGSTVLATTTTDANGRYVFKNLAADTYYVEAAVPATYSSSTDIVTSATPNAVDSDDNGAGSPSGGYIRSGAITLANDGGTPGSANWTETDHGVFIMGMLDPASNPKAYYTVDFGFLIPLPCTNPTATADADDATCVSGVAQSDGKITILSFTAGQRFRYSSGNTFNSGTATAMAAIPVGGVIVSNLPNITSDYTVRIFDAIDDNCYVDRVVTITLVVCCVNPSGITFSQSVPTCTGASANNNGTISLSSVTNGTHYGVSTLNAGSYNGPVFASATPIPGGLPIVIQSSISNTGGAYIVRTFNGSNDCYTDQTVTVTPVVCMCSPVPCGTTTAVKN